MTERGGETVVEVGPWTVITSSSWPGIISDYREHAELHERFDKVGSNGFGFFFTAIGRAAEEWPSLVISQQFSPSGAGFPPGVLVVPETEVVFIGAGTRLLCYQHGSVGWSRRWEDETFVGFWRWRRHGEVVVMSAEIELSAWSIDGVKLWTTFVEPPWSYEVADGTVRLDVMGKIRSFPLGTGPRR